MNETVAKAPFSDALAVAAFTKLRDEIDRRSGHQLTIMGVSLLAFSTLAGLVLAVPVGVTRPYALLLLTPLVSSAAGLLWLDHDRRIAEIGDYIRDHFAIPAFEEKADDLQKTWLTRFLGFVTPAGLVFPGPSAVALAWVCRAIPNELRWLWRLGAVLMLINILYLLVAFVQTRKLGNAA